MRQIGNATIYNQDILEWARTYDGPKFHAALLDPPYHLTPTSERFGKADAKPAQFGTDGVYQRSAAGFMGQQWDGGDIAFQPETWRALSAHLLPGAYLFAFAGTRGYHRMACAIEDAGFVIETCISYCFGSGFPKATRIDTAVDRRAGIEVEAGKAFNFKGGHNADGRAAEFMANGRTAVCHEAQSDAAKAWAGHRYGAGAMKPATELICVARLPYEGNPLDSILKYGAGALNIEAARVGTNGARNNGSNPDANGYAKNEIYGKFRAMGKQDYGVGRWPSTLILDETTAELLDAQSGVTSESRDARLHHGANGNLKFTNHKSGSFTPSYPDSGGASRFFHVANWNAEQAEELPPMIYCAKAGQAERNAGLDGNITQGKNPHPTIKPLKLCRILASILAPPADYAPRRILIPFGGVCSEAIGAYLAGWEEIVVVEQSAEYCEIGAKRLQFWQSNSGLFDSLQPETDADAAETACGNLFGAGEGGGL